MTLVFSHCLLVDLQKVKDPGMYTGSLKQRDKNKAQR